MKTSPTNRYFWLLNLLNTTGGLSKEEIDERWQHSSLNDTKESRIPSATFHYWKENILRDWNVEIRYNRAKDKYFIDKDELSGNRFFDWMIRSVSVAEVIRNSSQLRDRILLEKMPSGEQWLCTILECMKENVTFEMLYKRFDADQGHYMTFKPYCLKTFELRWYVVGESSDHPGETRVYALDRVYELTKGTERYQMPKNFDGEELFRDLYGVWLGTDRETEQLRFITTDLQANYFRTLPLHHSQRELGPASKKGWVAFELKIKITFDLIMKLRSYGKSLKILEPEWLKGEI